MNTDHLPERLNWKQACELLGCKKDTFYRLIREGTIQAYGVGKRCRWFNRAECERFIALSPQARADADGLDPLQQGTLNRGQRPPMIADIDRP